MRYISGSEPSSKDQYVVFARKGRIILGVRAFKDKAGRSCLRFRTTYDPESLKGDVSVLRTPGEIAAAWEIPYTKLDYKRGSWATAFEFPSPPTEAMAASLAKQILANTLDPLVKPEEREISPEDLVAFITAGWVPKMSEEKAKATEAFSATVLFLQSMSKAPEVPEAAEAPTQKGKPGK